MVEVQIRSCPGWWLTSPLRTGCLEPSSFSLWCSGCCRNEVDVPVADLYYISQSPLRRNAELVAPSKHCCNLVLFCVNFFLLNYQIYILQFKPYSKKMTYKMHKHPNLLHLEGKAFTAF